MASNTSTLGGYDCGFVDTPLDELMCLICTLVAKDPQQIQCCGKICCNDCLNEHLQRSSMCPQCDKEVKSFADTRSNRQIQELRVQCEHSASGCEWCEQLRDYEDHLSTCKYVLIACPNKCVEGEDEVKVFRMDLNNHLISKCRKRKHHCLYCEEEGEFSERTTTHLDECPKVKVHCPNDHCQDYMLRCEVSKHRETCEYETVGCKYNTIGCNTKISRKDLEKHEKDNQCHLRIAVETVLEQEATIKQHHESVEDLTKKQEAIQSEMLDLKQKMEQEMALKKRNSQPFRFKVINFSKFKKSNELFVSPPFLIHSGSYKMCVGMDAIGCGEGKGTHISLFAYLMRGENDEFLPWPFTGTVTVKLLNQLEDKNHYSQTVSFPGHGEFSKRVVSGERASTGYGWPKFVAQTALHHNGAKNCQYLKDDRLYFEVGVEAATSLKPWLIC